MDVRSGLGVYPGTASIPCFDTLSAPCIPWKARFLQSMSRFSELNAFFENPNMLIARCANHAGAQ